MPPNIAEGSGKFTGKDQTRFHDIARGSALECGACLDVLVAMEGAEVEDVSDGKELLVEIVAMLTGLAQRNVASDRVRADGAVYGDGDVEV